MRSFDIAATGMQAMQLSVDTISHNLANMTTTGYKTERPEFQDLIYQNLKRVGTNSSDSGTVVPTGIQIGLGVKTGAIYRNNQQGTMKQTEGALDVAIQGKGYFQVEMPDGTISYTRDGGFQLSPDGELVTKDGFVVQPAINIPEDATDVAINASGEVSVVIAGQTDAQIVGQLEMASFINPPGLQATGNNMFIETAASGDPIVGVAGETGFGTVLQGFLEQSNVNPVSEISNMIIAQRAYEMNSKVIGASDQMLQALTQSA